MRQIKARCAARGHTPGKRRKADRILLPLLTRIPAGDTELAYFGCP